MCLYKVPFRVFDICHNATLTKHGSILSSSVSCIVCIFAHKRGQKSSKDSLTFVPLRSLVQHDRPVIFRKDMLQKTGRSAAKKSRKSGFSSKERPAWGFDRAWAGPIKGTFQKWIKTFYCYSNIFILENCTSFRRLAPTLTSSRGNSAEVLNSLWNSYGNVECNRFLALALSFIIIIFPVQIFAPGT